MPLGLSFHFFVLIIILSLEFIYISLPNHKYLKSKSADPSIWTWICSYCQYFFLVFSQTHLLVFYCIYMCYIPLHTHTYLNDAHCL